MLKHNQKAAFNSIRFLLRIIDDERSVFTRFTISNTSISIARSNDNRNVTRNDVKSDSMVSKRVPKRPILNIDTFVLKKSPLKTRKILVKVLLSVKDLPSKRKVSERSDWFYSKELGPGYLVM